ncbi:serpin A9 [Castor canadensis]|uniref:Serpin A9 n=2 Tax=Castor canadensis TaxID=51338 RepID=A0AC58M0T2_CASCN
MASSFHRVLFLVGLCAPVYCIPPSSTPSKRPPKPPSMKGTPAYQVSRSNTNFAFHLYQRLVLQNPGRNIFFSPVSVSTSLAMLSLGARSATKSQILQSLNFSLTHTAESVIHLGFQHLVHSLNVPSKDRSLRVGSALFVRKGLALQADFLDRSKRLYEAKVFSTDFSSTFAAQEKINSYVAKETSGKVTDIIQDLDPLTAMVLVNHIFFKAKWTKPFNPADTIKGFSFLVGQGTTVHVPMMHQTEEFAFGVDPELDCSVLQMDYGPDTMALFVLPSKGKMGQLEQALSPRTLEKWSHSLQKRRIEVLIPRFSMSASYNLETILPKMGIHDAFDRNADFSGITKSDSLQVSKAAHKAVLAVSEEGTEAVAATATNIILRSKDGPSSPIICFNSTFLVMIIDKHIESMLFLGKVQNPTQV